MALTGNTSTLMRDGKQFEYGVEANAVIYQGAVVQQNGNNVEKGAKAASKKYVGIALEQVTGSATDGEVKVNVRRRVAAKLKVASGRSLALGATAYLEDDETVHDQDTGRSALGDVVAVDTDGVWVWIE